MKSIIEEIDDIMKDIPPEEVAKISAYDVHGHLNKVGEKETPHWISVKDRLPELVDSQYLVFVEGNHERKRIKICKWFGIKSQDKFVYRWLSSAFPAKHVTHWMPLPRHPEGT